MQPETAELAGLICLCTAIVTGHRATVTFIFGSLPSVTDGSHTHNIVKLITIQKQEITTTVTTTKQQQKTHKHKQRKSMLFSFFLLSLLPVS